MNSLQEFFAKFGLPPSWGTEDGDISVNTDDSGAHPDLSEGDEIFVSSDNIIIDGSEISILGACTPGNFKESFGADLEASNGPENVRRVKSMLIEFDKFEAGAWTNDL